MRKKHFDVSSNLLYHILTFCVKLKMEKRKRPHRPHDPDDLFHLTYCIK